MDIDQIKGTGYSIWLLKNNRLKAPTYIPRQKVGSKVCVLTFKSMFECNIGNIDIGQSMAKFQGLAGSRGFRFSADVGCL